MRELTLSVHEVGDGDGVNAIRLGGLGVENDIGARLGTGRSQILLSKSLNLLLNREASLERYESV